MDKKHKTLLVLALSCVLIRILMWFNYEPIAYPDTKLYQQLALMIKDIDFSNYLGERTPVYPLLMLLSGLNFKVLWLIQLIIGVATSLLLFRIALHETQNNTVSFIVGISYTLSLDHLFFEANIVTETLSTFLVVLSLWQLSIIFHSDSRKVINYLLIAIVLSLVGLTRPLLLFLIPLYFLFFNYIWIVKKVLIYDRIKLLISFMIPIAIIVFGWFLFNKITVNHFGPSTLLGVNLSNHSGSFMELAPDEYSDIRDIYLKHREKMLAAYGDHTQTIWVAYPELLEVTGLSYLELSEKLKEMSIKMFVSHPILYIESCIVSWARFWRGDEYWKPEKIKSENLRKVLKIAWWIQRFLKVSIGLLFLTIVIGYIYSIIVHKHKYSESLLLVMSIVISASVFQALAEFGENSRYSIPFQPLVFYTIIVWVWCQFYDKKIRNKKMASGSKPVF